MWRSQAGREQGLIKLDGWKFSLLVLVLLGLICFPAFGIDAELEAVVVRIEPILLKATNTEGEWLECRGPVPFNETCPALLRLDIPLYPEYTPETIVPVEFTEDFMIPMQCKNVRSGTPGRWSNTREILLKPTLWGDLDGDGKINIIDLYLMSELVERSVLGLD